MSTFKEGDRVVDLVDSLGEGTIIDVYTNRMDCENGQETVTVEFLEENPEGSQICDRLPNEISTAPSPSPSGMA